MHAQVAFSEEFQAEYLRSHFATFDELRAAGVLVGEHVWNFADFMTGAGVTRVVGNRKGIFTRNRQPKLAARTLRERYHRLINESRGLGADPNQKNPFLLVFAGVGVFVVLGALAVNI